MKTFSVRDLRERSGELIRQAESGHLSIVAKHGRRLFVAVPLDEHLLKEGVAVAIAVRLFADHVVSLGKAAKLARMPIESFLQTLGAMGIPAVDYPPEELDEDLTALAAMPA